MSTPSVASRRGPLPALTLGSVLHLDASGGELSAEMIGLREIAGCTCCSALVEHALLLGVRRRLLLARDEAQHAEHVVDLLEQVLQRPLRLNGDRPAVE